MSDVARRITVQQLLDHRSGLGDILNERWERADRNELVNPRDFFPLFVDQPLEFEPGTRSSYSNAGYVLLGAIVEKVSGMAYAEYLDRHVFAPAGMKRSGFPARTGKSSDLAVGYTTEPGGRDDGEPRPNLGMLPVRDCPAGSSAHTAEDLLRLDRALRAGKLLDPAWTAWVYTNARRPGPEPTYFLGVAGGGPGVSAGMESNGAATSIVLSNLDPPSGERLAIDLFRVLESGS